MASDRCGRVGILVVAVAAILGALAIPVGQVGAAQPVVTIDSSSADIDTFQALSSSVEQSRDRSGNDFFAFAEGLNPPVLKGPEGKADTFVSQASTIISPAQPPFPASPVHGIGTSGRARVEANKSSNPAPGVPVADANGSFSADFETSGPTPFQFSGALLTSNDDHDDCSEITVQLSGSFNRTFTAHQGGGCSGSAPHSRGFVVQDVLPAGSYELSTDYDAEVDPEAHGQGVLTGTAAIEADLSFFPPNTKIAGAKINAQGGKATFRFKAIGRSKGFQCALARGHHDPRFRGCSSPKTYKHLKSGRYEFEVAALGLGGPDATPAKKRFRIP